VETNELVCSNSNVILTRQTCGHGSSRVAGSKHRALAFYFPVRIWYMFFMSKYREELDLGQCAWVRYLQREYSCVVPTSNDSCGQVYTFKSEVGTAFSLQVPNSCIDLDLTLLYISILKTHAKFVRKNKILALGVCFPQSCSSAGCRFAASRSRLKHYRPVHSFPQRPIR